ncbi:putative PLP-dependent enzyme possibly involved in cell wall biogenesis [Microbacterium sp. HM58-2]|nr:putative PLP-dependent enzyme possibly involved in cell wall biogenesis [Microbacterium sp. HM58-2]
MRLNVPLTGDEELEEIRDVLGSGYLTQGPKAAEFEAGVRAVTTSAFAFAVSSATTGLHLTLVALGVQPGDEVIMPAFSFPATANAVAQQGAIPVFVDIRPETYNIDPSLIEASITPRTRAIMPVHAFGLTADMDPINELAQAHGLPVIEDAACALGATYHGRAAGSLATAGVFSFHPRKIITTGEGGMITTDDDKLADRLRVLRAHGAVRGDLFMEFVDVGFNYRMSDVHAAIGIAQLRKLGEILQQRRALAAELSSRLHGIPGVRTPVTPKGLEHSFQSYVVMLAPEIDRDEVIRRMREHDVETTLGTYGMHLQPAFVERFGPQADSLPNATDAHYRALTLPLYPQLDAGDLDRIAAALRASVSG